MSPVMIAAFTALLMLGLLVEALFFTAFRDDPPATYRLFAVRDKLIRLVAEKKISAEDRMFMALYENITILLRASRCISGPEGWSLAEQIGKAFARGQIKGAAMKMLPAEDLPPALGEVIKELRGALKHLIHNHVGIFVQMDSRRRELTRMQKEQAKRLLSMIPQDGSCPI